MTTLAPVAPRLSKLLALLSSDHDGEVLAAARAIRRTLGRAGLSLHDLAAAITASAKGGQLAHPSWSRMSREHRLRTLTVCSPFAASPPGNAPSASASTPPCTCGLARSKARSRAPSSTA